MLEVIFLGTGAAAPTAFRNLSSTAVIIDGEIALFDCGEGTQMQFKKAKLRPGKITRIFISHFHGDHIFGLPGLLTSMQMAGCTQHVSIYGPAGIQDFLDFHSAFSSYRLAFDVTVHEVAENSDNFELREGRFMIKAMALSHRIRCIGWSLSEMPRPGKFNARQAEQLGVPNGALRRELQNGNSIHLNGREIPAHLVIGPARRGHSFAYCLDTAPCDAAVALGRDADILVHDATFLDEEIDAAKVSGHSTVSQAAEIARRAGAHRLALTHVSGRYAPGEYKSKVPVFESGFPAVFAANDLFRLKIEYAD